jgi:hypothetical protein
MAIAQNLGHAATDITRFGQVTVVNTDFPTQNGDGCMEVRRVARNLDDDDIRAASASAVAMAAPMPPLAPVTKAVLPSSLNRSKAVVESGIFIPVS